MAQENGWYQDPTVPGQLRWWDGVQWTANTRREEPAVWTMDLQSGDDMVSELLGEPEQIGGVGPTGGGVRGDVAGMDGHRRLVDVEPEGVLGNWVDAPWKVRRCWMSRWWAQRLLSFDLQR
jgi:hypothetical protein